MDSYSDLRSRAVDSLGSVKGTFRFVGRFFFIIGPSDMKFVTDMQKHSGFHVKKKIDFRVKYES